MSAFVNDRDVMLQATVPRNIDPTRGKALLLTVDTAMFRVSAAGVGAPAVATLTARGINIPGAVQWSATGGVVLGGTGDNVRTLAFGDMTAPSVQVTISIIYEGQAYLATQTISKVADGSSANVTAAVVLPLLEGQITEAHLLAALRTRISLIDDPATTAGSVAARVKSETDARALAVQGEVDARINALLAESGARTTYVQGYTFSKAETNSALSIQASALAAYTDTKNGEAIAAAAADVRNYSYGKTTVDASEAAQSAALTTAYTTYADAKKTEAISAASTDVRSYAYGKSSTDSAIATMASTLRSEFSSSNGASTAYVQNYAYSKSQIDSAEASQSSSLTAAYTSYVEGRVTNVIEYSAADVRTYAYGKATVDGAIATSVNQVSARLDNIGGVTIEQKFVAQATVNGGLSAQLTFKIDNNGAVTGYGLASESVNGAPQSAFAILADRFLVVGPNGPEAMFSVGGGTVGFSGLLKGPSGSFGTVTIAPGGSISSGQTAYDTGSGFFIDGVKSGTGAHGARMSIGVSGGKKFLCDPDNNVLGLYDATLSNPIITLPAFTASIGSSLSTYKASNARATVGTVTASVVGGTAPFSYIWAVSSLISDIDPANISYAIVSPNAASTSLEAYAYDNGLIANLILVVTDTNGRSALAKLTHSVHFGAYQ